MNRDTLRLVVSGAFAFCLLLLYQRWEIHTNPLIQEQSANPEIPSQQGSLATTAQPAAEQPVLTQDLLAADDDQSRPSTLPTSPARSDQAAVAWLHNDAVRAGFAANGSLVQLQLLRHLVDNSNEALPLLYHSASGRYVVQSGLLGEGLPTHSTAGWQSTARNARELISAWHSNLVEITLKSELAPSGYLATLHYDIRNLSSQPLTVHAYFQIVRNTREPAGYSSLTPSFYGAVSYSEDTKFSKYQFDELEDYPVKTDNGWLGIVQRYFITAWLDGGSQRENYMRQLGSDEVAVGVIRPFQVIAPGASASLSQPLFAGALEQDLLHEINPEIGKGIDLAVDYGWLTILAAPLFVLLELIESGTGNWGAAIMLLTLLVKLVFYPLSAASFRSMARMKKLAPKIKMLKERHGDDKQAFQKALMESYRKEKVNPLGGCLPILIQIPVFIALYWVLLGSVELRHAPLALWISDLSAPDPYYVLPMLLGGAMVLQTRMNPTPPDPTQAMIIKIMPIGFALFSIFFPTGLVLYWITNTGLSMLQQWHVTRTLGKDGADRKQRHGSG